MTDVFFGNIWYCDKLLSDILHCWKLNMAHFCNFYFYTYVYIFVFVTSLNQPISIKFYIDTWIWLFQKYANFQINSISGYWDINIKSRVALGVGVSVVCDGMELGIILCHLYTIYMYNTQFPYPLIHIIRSPWTLWPSSSVRFIYLLSGKTVNKWLRITCLKYSISLVHFILLIAVKLSF